MIKKPAVKNVHYVYKENVNLGVEHDVKTVRTNLEKDITNLK